MSQDSKRLADLGQGTRGISPENPVTRENMVSGKEEVSGVFFRSQLQKSISLAQPLRSENVQRINLEKSQAPIILGLNEHELAIPEDDTGLTSPDSVLKQFLPQKSEVENEPGSYFGTLKRKLSPTYPDQSRAGENSSNLKGRDYHHDFLRQDDGYILSTRAETSREYKSSSGPQRISPTEINRIPPKDPGRLLSAEQKWISPTYPQRTLLSEPKRISPTDVQIQQSMGVHRSNVPLSFDPDFKFQSLEPAPVIHIPETTYTSSMYANKDTTPFLQDYAFCAMSREDAFGHTVEQPIPHQTSSAMPYRQDTVARNALHNEQLADDESVRCGMISERFSPQNFHPKPECKVASDSRGMSILSFGYDPQMTSQGFRYSRQDRPHSYQFREQVSTAFADQILNQVRRDTLQGSDDQNTCQMSDHQSSNYGTVHVSSEKRGIYADPRRDVLSYERDVMAPNTTADAVYYIQPSTANPPSSVSEETVTNPDLGVINDWTADDFLDLWDSSELLNQYAKRADISDPELVHITGLCVSHNKAGNLDLPRYESPLNFIKTTMANLGNFESTVSGTLHPSAIHAYIDAQTGKQPRATRSRLEGPSQTSRMMSKEPIKILALREAIAQQEEPQLTATEGRYDYDSNDKLRVADYHRCLLWDASTQTEPLPVKCVADKCQQMPDVSINLQTTISATCFEVPEPGINFFEDFIE